MRRSTSRRAWKGQRRLSRLAEIAPRNRSLADEDQDRRVGQGVNTHWLLRAVDGDVRTTAAPARARACHRTLRTEHHVGRFERRGLRADGVRAHAAASASVAAAGSQPIGPFARTTAAMRCSPQLDRDSARRLRCARRSAPVSRVDRHGVTQLPIKHKQQPKGGSRHSK